MFKTRKKGLWYLILSIILYVILGISLLGIYFYKGEEVTPKAYIVGAKKCLQNIALKLAVEGSGSINVTFNSVQWCANRATYYYRFNYSGETTCYENISGSVNEITETVYNYYYNDIRATNGAYDLFVGDSDGYVPWGDFNTEELKEIEKELYKILGES